MQLDDLQTKLSDMPTEDIIKMVEEIRRGRSQTARVTEKKKEKTTKTAQNKLLSLIAGSGLTIEDLKRMAKDADNKSEDS